MAQPVKRKRSYDSSRRQEQARATRRAVVEAARTLFVERGYAATSIEVLADRAGVSPETVYAGFKNKRGLLQEILDVSIVGDHAPVPLLDRAWVEQLQEEADLERRCVILARNGRLILERLTPIYGVLRGAAAADREVAALEQRYKAQRRAGQSELVRLIGRGQRLRAGLTLERAADIVYALGSPDTYELLVGDRGWSSAAFERWYASELRQLFR